MEECNHTEKIAKDLYLTFRSEQTRQASWDSLSDNAKKGWTKVAQEAIPTVARHALSDIQSYLHTTAEVSTGWKKALHLIGSAIIGALLAGGTMSLTNCGHSVTVNPDGSTTVCKDGICFTVSMSQGQPVTSEAPKVIKQTK